VWMSRTAEARTGMGGGAAHLVVANNPDQLASCSYVRHRHAEEREKRVHFVQRGLVHDLEWAWVDRNPAQVDHSVHLLCGYRQGSGHGANVQEIRSAMGRQSASAKALSGPLTLSGSTLPSESDCCSSCNRPPQPSSFASSPSFRTLLDCRRGDEFGRFILGEDCRNCKRHTHTPKQC